MYIFFGFVYTKSSCSYFYLLLLFLFLSILDCFIKNFEVGVSTCES